LAEVPEMDLIHLGDVVDVDFAGGFDEDWRGPLTPDGNLEGLDSVGGPIYALCFSTDRLAAQVQKVYSRILRDPQVTVRIIDRSNRPLARMDGAVKTPTRFRLLRPVHLRELIVAAGGITDETSGEIQIFRPANANCEHLSPNGTGPPSPSGNGLRTINITIKDLLKGKPDADPLILSGDVIAITKAEPIYVIGAVNNPRPLYSHGGMSLSRAIDSVGGVAKGGISQNISIFRREGPETKVLTADLEKIKSGIEGDVELKPFDIIDVAFRGRPQRKYPPVIAGGNGTDKTAEPPLKIIE
jgi:protein involved in polysaccharide export with SLBB domain